MSILGGLAIRRILGAPDPADRLVVAPLFELEEQIRESDASIDLHLGCRFSAARRRNLTHYPREQGLENAGLLTDQYYVPFHGHFVLHPNHFVLAATLEWVKLPRNVAGYILGRSTYGRMGLIIATATGVHPSYSGIITLELTNLAEIPIKIHPGEAICQLVLHSMSGEISNEPEGGRSRYAASLFPEVKEPRKDLVRSFLSSAQW